MARTRAAALALTGLGAAMLFGAPGALRAQAVSRPLTAAEAEAYQMGLELAFACSPRRHGQAAGSASTVRRERDALAGTAVTFQSVDGTYVVLEEYDEALAGHCLVVGWFGGALAPGHHAIGRLAMTTVEDEVASGTHSFFAMAAVRTASENSMLVVESGSLDITAVEGERVEGTFELRGFLTDSSGRSHVGQATWAGSFRAVAGEP